MENMGENRKINKEKKVLDIQTKKQKSSKNRNSHRHPLRSQHAVSDGIDIISTHLNESEFNGNKEKNVINI